jgi:hypothetical protein
MALIDMRRAQMFPVLSPAQIETAKRFASGTPERFAPGETLFDAGDRAAPAWLVLEGSIMALRRCQPRRRRSAPISKRRGSALNGNNLQAYFIDLLTRLVSGWHQKRIGELVPWNWALRQPP